MLAPVLQQPKQQEQVSRGGFQQQGKINMMRAETHAIFLSWRAAFLVEGLDLLGDRVALQNAEILAQAESDARAQDP